MLKIFNFISHGRPHFFMNPGLSIFCLFKMSIYYLIKLKDIILKQNLWCSILSNFPLPKFSSSLQIRTILSVIQTKILGTILTCVFLTSCKIRYLTFHTSTVTTPIQDPAVYQWDYYHSSLMDITILPFIFQQSLSIEYSYYFIT